MKRGMLVVCAVSAGCPGAQTPIKATPSQSARLPDGTELVCMQGQVLHERLDGAHCTRETSGRRDGPFASFWPDGKPLAKGAYDDGAPDGEWTAWYQDGSVRMHGTYAKGRRTGEWTLGLPGDRPAEVQTIDDDGNIVVHASYEYEPDGRLRRLWSYKDLGEAPPGVMRRRFIDNGLQQSRWEDTITSWTAADDIPTGAATMVNDAGLELAHLEFGKDGYLDGPVTAHWASGGLAIEGAVDHGTPSGTWKGLYESGTVAFEIAFDGADEHVRTYHPDGSIDAEGDYLQSGPSGHWTRRDPSGAILLEGDFDAGFRHGVWVQRDAAGKTIVSGTYERGLLVKGKNVPPLRWDGELVVAPIDELTSVIYSTSFNNHAWPKYLGQMTGCWIGKAASSWNSCSWISPDTALSELDKEELSFSDQMIFELRQMACSYGDAQSCLKFAEALLGRVDPVDAAGALEAACEQVEVEAAYRATDENRARDAPWGAMACATLGNRILDGKVPGSAHDGWDLLERGCAAGEGEACALAYDWLMKDRPPRKKNGKPRPPTAADQAKAKDYALRGCAATTPAPGACALIATWYSGDEARPWLGKACDAGHEASCQALGRDVPFIIRE